MQVVGSSGLAMPVRCTAARNPRKDHGRAVLARPLRDMATAAHGLVLRRGGAARGCVLPSGPRLRLNRGSRAPAVSVSAAAVFATGSAGGKYARELEAAADAVRLACGMCQRIQLGIMIKEEQEGLDTKKDKSLVTTADYAAQAIISRALAEAFPGDLLVAEEETNTLGSPAGAPMLALVAAAVNGALGEAGRPAMTRDQILDSIQRGQSPGSGRKGRHWVLDPVDGTFGFVRGDQYAVSLGLVEDGVVVAGVLGCPNMPTGGETLDCGDSISYGFSPRQLNKMLAFALERYESPAQWHRGVVFTAAKGSGAFASPSSVALAKTIQPKPVSVAVEAPLGGGTRFCEPVLKANSSQGFTAAVAGAMGIGGKKPLRVYSSVKYGSVARGDAAIFMKFPKAGYQEKVWDHAAGVIIVQEAGGVVTDASGNPLDFGAGRLLEGLDRGIVAAAREAHPALLRAVAAAWEATGGEGAATGD